MNFESNYHHSLPYSVFMRGVTWNRDSHGLFDYESKSIAKQAWNTQEESRILRVENDIKIVPLHYEKHKASIEGQSEEQQTLEQTLLLIRKNEV